MRLDLPGPVDDPHAAAGDLLQQLVIAEVADRAGRVLRRVARAEGGGHEVVFFLESGHEVGVTGETTQVVVRPGPLAGPTAQFHLRGQ